MREFFHHTLIIEKPIQDCFNYIAHTFENAPAWMEGCKNITVRLGFERFGMWEGKTYDRTFALPFHIGSSTKPDVILTVEEDNPYKFETKKRFVVTMKFPGVDPIFDYRFTAISAHQTEFDYSISTKHQGPVTQYFMVPLMLSVINGRLSRSHPYLKTLIEEKPSPIAIIPTR
ncbi:hypothetical protein A9Q81_27840 [Gammaproteobacteria bacterium 42_54_T18]|nr:hypothetical protein A9Q81_27840 [Gammaproteobacteria bacterium 42_54_T18]